jgi:hypothetical protein
MWLLLKSFNEFNVNPGFRGLSLELIVLTQPTVTTEPGKGSLHHPALRERLKSFERRVSFQDSQRPAKLLSDPALQVAVAFVDTVGPDHPEALAHHLSQSLQHRASTMIILNSGRLNHDGQEVAFGVNGDMPFTPFDFLMVVKAL